nr:2-methylcitrate dehydratase [Burkholderia sp. Ac-20379]
MSVPQTTARPAPGPVRAEALGAVPGFEIGSAIAPATARHGRLGALDRGMAFLSPRACSGRPRLPGT